jgi:hypothetical protein
MLPIFIRQGWPQAMSHLPWIGSQAPCYPPSPLVAWQSVRASATAADQLSYDPARAPHPCQRSTAERIDADGKGLLLYGTHL